MGQGSLWLAARDKTRQAGDKAERRTQRTMAFCMFQCPKSHPAGWEAISRVSNSKKKGGVLRGRNANQTLRPSFLFTLSLLFQWLVLRRPSHVVFFGSCCFPFTILLCTADPFFVACLVGESIAIGPISSIDRLSEGNDQGARRAMVLAVGSTTDVAQTRYVCTRAVCFFFASSSPSSFDSFPILLHPSSLQM